jgi:hypothetical protein
MLCGRPSPGGLIELGGDRKHLISGVPASQCLSFTPAPCLALAPSTACSGETNGQTVRQKATSGAPSRLIEDLEVIANLLS